MRPAHKPPTIAIITALVAVLVTALAATPALGQARTGLQWARFLGGAVDEGSGRAAKVLAPNGDIVLGGRTDSANFTTRNAWQQRHAGPSPAPYLGFGDGFVARLSGNGGGLIWSTFFGGSAEDAVLGAVADAVGVTVCGVTRSQDFPTTSAALQTSPGGLADGFVARFVWDGQQLQLLWSTYLGGSQDDTITGLAVHPSGVVVVTGATRSTDFPMGGTPFQPASAGFYDGFVAVLDGAGSSLLASTYLGGSGDDFAWTWAQPGSELLYASQVSLDRAGNPVVAAITASTNFPTTPNAFQQARVGGYEGVVVRMDLALSRLTYSTFLGGSALDLLSELEMTPQGHIAVSGMTGSWNYPTTPGCFQPNMNPTTTCPYADGFVTVLDTRELGGNQLVYSSFYGGTGCDHAVALAVDHRGMLLLGGITRATNLPTSQGAYQGSLAGSWDAWLAQIDTTQSGLRQLRYATYLGGSCSGFDITGGILPDGEGNAVLIGATNCSNFPTTTGPNFGGGSRDLFVAKLNLLPQDVTRYGWSTPACLHPIYQTVNSWPVAGNASFTLEANRAPPNAFGLLALGTPNTTGWKLLRYLDAFVNPTMLAVAAVAADPNGLAEHTLSLPANLTPAVPPYGIATQWFFLTTAGCPGTGPASASEGLAW